MHFFVILKHASLVSVCTSAQSPSSMLIPTLTPSPLPPLSPTQIPSQTIGASSSWGPIMMPGEVQELLASEPQTGEYYVITKGHKLGVYLFWWVTYSWVNIPFKEKHIQAWHSWAHQGVEKPLLLEEDQQACGSGAIHYGIPKGQLWVPFPIVVETYFLCFVLKLTLTIYI